MTPTEGADDGESGFAGDFLETSREESAARGHAFDCAEWVFGGAAAPPDQPRIGLGAGVHPSERLFVQVTADEAAFCGRAAWLERAVSAVACRVNDEAVSPHQLLARQGAASRADIDVRFGLNRRTGPSAAT